MMINPPSKFVKIIRQKVIVPPLQNHELCKIKEKVEDVKVEIKEEEAEVKPITNGGSKYIAIDNADMEQRVQHTIRNLMELDIEELAYIEDMNCKNMFIIVVLLNKVVATLVENMMAMD